MDFMGAIGRRLRETTRLLSEIVTTLRGLQADERQNGQTHTKRLGELGAAFSQLVQQNRLAQRDSSER